MSYFRFTLFVFFLSASISIAGDSAEAVTKKFIEALAKSDKGTALKLLKKFPEAPNGFLEDTLNRLAENTSNKGTTPRVVASKELTEVAVVVIDEAGPDSKGHDYDPIYLLKEGDSWLLTINMKLDGRSVKVSSAVQAEFATLKAWFDAKKAELKAQG